MPFTLNPEFGATVHKLFGPDPPPVPPAGDVASRRTAVEGLFDLIKSQSTPVEGVSSRPITVTTPEGIQLESRWYTKDSSPASASNPTSAILYAHGGGMIALSIKHYDQAIARYVALTGVPALAVEYRLAPESPAPGPVSDLYAGLEYLASHASELGIDPSRIVAMGDSAGGGITAGLTHYVKARPQGPQLKKQILIYPMLDDRNVEVDPDLQNLAVWTAVDNLTGWGALLGDRRGKNGVTPDMAPARMTVEDARGLPEAYIDVGELDIFRDESIEYAKTLTRAAVSTEFHLTPGVPHGYEAIAPQLDVAKATMALRAKAILSV